MSTSGETTTRKTKPFKHAWQQSIQDAKDAWTIKHFPSFAAASEPLRGKWNDETANGLTKCVIDYLKFIGGNFTRVNVMGTPRKDKKTGRTFFTPSTTKKGTADIVGVFRGRYTAIEVKIGADIQSKFQIQEQRDVTEAGGVYIIARNFPDFLNEFKTIFKLN
jgi:hypothetical protein